MVRIHRHPSSDLGSIAIAELLSQYLDTELIVVDDLNLNWLNHLSDYFKVVSGQISI